MINTNIQNAMECSSDFDIALACVWEELSDTQTIDIMKFARGIEKSKFNLFALERIADYLKRFPLTSAREAFELLTKEGSSYSTGLDPEDSEIPATIKVVDTCCLPTSKEDSDGKWWYGLAKTCVVCAKNRDLHEFTNLRNKTIEIILEPELMDVLVEHAMRQVDDWQFCLTTFGDRNKLPHDEYSMSMSKSEMDEMYDTVESDRDEVLRDIELLKMIVEKRRQTKKIDNEYRLLLHEERKSKYYRHQIDRLYCLIAGRIRYIFRIAQSRGDNTKELKAIGYVLETILRQARDSVRDECKYCFSPKPSTP